MLENKSILLTGGTGSFGHAFVPMTLAKFNPQRLVSWLRAEAAGGPGSAAGNVTAHGPHLPRNRDARPPRLSSPPGKRPGGPVLGCRRRSWRQQTDTKLNAY
jgi:hypothetical protein